MLQLHTTFNTNIGTSLHISWCQRIVLKYKLTKKSLKSQQLSAVIYCFSNINEILYFIICMYNYFTMQKYLLNFAFSYLAYHWTKRNELLLLTIEHKWSLYFSAHLLYKIFSPENVSNMCWNLYEFSMFCLFCSLSYSYSIKSPQLYLFLIWEENLSITLVLFLDF